MKGGIFARGYFLKKIHKLSYTDYIVSIGAATLINLAVAGIFGILLLIFIFLRSRVFNIYLFLFFSAITIVFFILAKLPKPKKTTEKKNNLLIKKLYDFLSSWNVLSGNKKAIYELSILMLLNFIIYALRIEYGFHILFKDVPLANCLIISILGVLTNIFAVTPAALGIKEFVVGTTYRLMNGNMVDAIVVATVDRAISMILVFILGLISCYVLLKKHNEYISNARNK